MLSARAKYRREQGTAPEHRMIRDMEANGELPTGKHANRLRHCHGDPGESDREAAAT